MDINLFDYHLPKELIAQHPARNRDESRLMVLDRSTGITEIHPFRAVEDYVYAGDTMVVNNTRVFKARLLGKRATGGEVEIFLVRRTGGEELFWEAMARPSRRLKEGETIYFGSKDDQSASDLVLSENRGNRWIVKFTSVSSRDEIIERYGHIPLPQYIRRSDTVEDVERYQTIFARQDQTGAVAAPTAGFHFTPTVVERLREKGVNLGELTLHVGPGTFKPVEVENIEDHAIDPEYASVSDETASLINRTRMQGGKVIAVGTTSVRTLEFAAAEDGTVVPFAGEADLYIRPGYKFKVVDKLLTNFHLPKSSLLILVSAFAGREMILEAYRRAVAESFRFYSYGDAMLIL